MPPLDLKTEDKSLFRGLVLNTETPEEIEQKANDLLATAETMRQKQNEVVKAAKEKEKQNDMNLLEKHRADLKRTVGLLTLPGKLDLADLTKLQDEKDSILEDIHEIEVKYGIAQLVADPEQSVVKSEKSVTKMQTVLKVIGLVVVIWAIIFGSGDLIMEYYPNAAVYNVVSFQKVLFAFSVFMAGIACVVAGLTIFFPGHAKYFNPFNRDSLDFFNDFKSLSEWHRVLISVVLFSSLFFAFVMIVSGKLD
ncbi:hypothetical protein Dfri01_39040 [Dyadobacter frigoris]|uniref:hypothetical protein n=1 Tax=Dyadobacter frigoris TaxID=2576211 RepID=UPI0024A4CF0C|nr:hypothetical protein [Dyadobacter frigoris]GLU54443.1 hypothetical protein Dfri01_39040 [Dyadobacter frigoris]